MTAREGGRRDVDDLVDRLFRAESARLVAGLARVFGPAHLELVEDVVQESLVRALRVWPYEGVPPHPEAWLVRVARNAAVDALRKNALEESKVLEVHAWAESRARGDASDDLGLRDDQLKLVFACCHPSLAFDARVALTLKACCGLGTGEIARAFRSDEATIAQRLVRTKRRLQEERIPLEVPDPEHVGERLEAVCQVIYLLFNEGYSAHRGESLVRADLVHEAVRLADLLVGSPATALPRVHALLGLMSFLGARLPARTDDLGDVVTLSRQDRALWDATWLARGWRHFEASLAGDEMSSEHVECAIAACHAAARTYTETDWRAVLRRYDQLLALKPTPVVRLNRAVAVAKVHGVRAGLEALAELEGEATMADDPLMHATRGLFLWHAGESAAAERAFEIALAGARTEPERRLLERRVVALRAGDAPESF